MIEIKRLPQFIKWINNTDNVTRVRLNKRLDKVSRGLLGDVKSVGDGVFEMREHFGAGYRMYYIERGNTLIVMLGGGDKSNQSKDIENAKHLAQTLED
ncbi:MAG: addiction module killer protein [Proteobacteria bacterium]|nr:MAG: addiction module killer protein [Pseudomonadota bacterium]